MNNIHEIVKKFLHEAEWKYEEADEEVIRFGIKGAETDYDLIFNCDEDRQTLILIGLKTALIPEPYRPQAAELLTRANYILNIGSYGMDYSDGEFRFRIGYNVEDGELSVTMVRNITIIAGRMLEQMYPCIMKLVYGNGNVDDLFEEWKNK